MSCVVLRPSRSRRLRRASSVAVSSQAVFFWGWGGEGQNFAKFRPEKYDFDLYKGFFIARFQGFFFLIARF
jgi:hypothetical protein